MSDARLIVLAPEELRQAVELWLNTRMLQQPVQVVEVRQKSPKAKDAGHFHVTWLPGAGDTPVSYPQHEE